MTEPFFVRMENVDSLRIELLESSKLILHSMHVEHNLAEMQERKNEAILELNNQIKELSFLNTKLEEVLPHMNLFEKELKAIKKPLTLKSKGKKKVVSKKIVNTKDVDKIALALSEIEKKLKDLN